MVTDDIHVCYAHDDDESDESLAIKRCYNGGDESDKSLAIHARTCFLFPLAIASVTVTVTYNYLY